MSALSMDQVLDALETGRQRATYGAVAAILNSSPRTLMSGRERNPRHSWIVNVRSGLPTEYPDELVHPELTTNSVILRTREDLTVWLADRGVHVPAQHAA